MTLLDYSRPRTNPTEPVSRLTIAVPAIISAATGLLLMGFVVQRWPVNHWGFDTRWLLVIPVACATWSTLTLITRGVTRRQFLLALAISVACAALIYGVDRVNLLVEYDRWTARGMPDAWSR